MARPIKHNADYFSHDSDMRNDQKINALRNKFGLDGYAIWCMFLEVLTDKDFFKYPWNEMDIELLAADFRIDSNRLSEIAEYSVKIKLLCIEDGMIFSPNHIRRFQSLMSKRDRDRNDKIQVFAADNKGTRNENRVFAAENTQSKIKEIRVKENDIDKSVFAQAKVEAKPQANSDLFKSHTQKKSIEEREAEFSENVRYKASGYSEKMIHDFIRYWSESNPNGKKMRFEMQTTFDISRRLATWADRDKISGVRTTQKVDFRKGSSFDN